MSTAARINATMACIVMLAATGAVGAGAVLCNATSRNRPADDLPTIAPPPPATQTQPLFASEMPAATNHQATAIRTKVPAPAPVMSINPIIDIDVRHQHQETMTENLAQDIRNAGGHLTSFKNYSAAQESHLTATVPSQYLDRIKPLLRSSSEHINPQYEHWTDDAAAQPATKHHITDQPTSLTFIIKGKFFESVKRQRIVVGTIVASVTALLMGAVLLIATLARADKLR